MALPLINALFVAVLVATVFQAESRLSLPSGLNKKSTACYPRQVIVAPIPARVPRLHAAVGDGYLSIWSTRVYKRYYFCHLAGTHSTDRRSTGDDGILDHKGVQVGFLPSLTSPINRPEVPATIACQLLRDVPSSKWCSFAKLSICNLRRC